jgi:tRNA (guanine-N7-)-methyltransferase
VVGFRFRPRRVGRVWAVTEPTGQPVRAPRVQREVTSFVRRSSRMRPVHLRAWERLRHAYVLEVPQRAASTSVAPGRPLDVAAAFGRTAPLVVEIGPGTGESLVTMAAARPEMDVLAFEVYLPGIARTVHRLHETGVANVRLVPSDAVDGLTHLLGPGSLQEVWTFFPDPWPKARHHKRRLVDRAFADLVASRLRPGGLWRLATDWADYAEQIRSLLDAQPQLVNEGGGRDGWAERWPDRPLTRFERRGIEAGRTVHDLRYRRR